LADCFDTPKTWLRERACRHHELNSSPPPEGTLVSGGPYISHHSSHHLHVVARILQNLRRAFWVFGIPCTILFQQAPQSAFFHSPAIVLPHANTYHSSAIISQRHGASTAILPFIVSSPQIPQPESLNLRHNSPVKTLHGRLQNGEHLDVHSHNITSKSVGKSPIAAGALPSGMANRTVVHPLPPRPPLLSHQSNSVPSTPHQHAKEFRTRSRSPSPHAGLGNGSHSPRSVKSEANGPMATLPRGRPTCKYETSAAFSRRRIQYDIGDAPLDAPKEEPKKTLDPHEEKKLSGDMRELYDRLLPSAESEKRRVTFIEKLEGILRKQWPTAEFKVSVFGSSGNMLCTNDSDGMGRWTSTVGYD